MSEILFTIPKYWYFAKISSYYLSILWFCSDFCAKDMNMYLAFQILTAFLWRIRKNVKEFDIYGNLCLYDCQFSSVICLYAIASACNIFNNFLY